MLAVDAWPSATRRFVEDSVRFRREDARWFARYPLFLLRPRFHPPAAHAGHFDPGQRALNCVVVLSFLVLAITGALMSFPQHETPRTFAISFRVHIVATWALGVAVAGHVLVASGVHRGYRRVWRAMHLGGRVPLAVARRLWPAWAEDAERSDEADGRRT